MVSPPAALAVAQPWRRRRRWQPLRLSRRGSTGLWTSSFGRTARPSGRRRSRGRRAMAGSSGKAQAKSVAAAEVVAAKAPGVPRAPARLLLGQEAPRACGERSARSRRPRARARASSLVRAKAGGSPGAQPPPGRLPRRAAGVAAEGRAEGEARRRAEVVEEARAWVEGSCGEASAAGPARLVAEAWARVKAQEE